MEKSGVSNVDDIIRFIDKGLVECFKKSRIYNDLYKLKKKVKKFDTKRLNRKNIFFNPEDNFGFIQRQEKKLFFHIKDFIDKINLSRLNDFKRYKNIFQYIKINEKG